MAFDRDWVVHGELVTPESLPNLLRMRAREADNGAGPLPVTPSRGDLLLQIPANAHASEIFQGVSIAQDAGFHRVYFLGRSAVVPSVPPFADPDFARAIDAAIAKDDQDSLLSSDAYDEVTNGVVEACPPLDAYFAAHRGPPPDDLCAAVVATLETALPKCPNADHRKIITLFQHTPDRGAPPFTLFSTRFDPSAPPFAARPDEAWKDIAPRLRAHGPVGSWVVDAP